ncbi:MAG: RHS repeat-associated core domain-containing protein [Myxococcales bacterium]
MVRKKMRLKSVLFGIALLACGPTAAALAEAEPADERAASTRSATELRWDHRGRLATATSHGHAGSYFYADGVERVLEEHDGSVTYYIGPNFELRDGVAIHYARAADRRVARMGTTTLQASVLNDPELGTAVAPRIDVADAWRRRAERTPLIRHLYASARRLLLEHTPSTVFLHHDRHGSTTLASGPDAQLLGDCAFHASGANLARTGYVDTYGFTGQRTDPTTGLVHFPFRELDPRFSRWLSPDPMFLRDGNACLARPFECRHGYAYATNNPVDLVDPTGEVVFVIAFDGGVWILVEQTAEPGEFPTQTLYTNDGKDHVDHTGQLWDDDRVEPALRIAQNAERWGERTTIKGFGASVSVGGIVSLNGPRLEVAAILLEDSETDEFRSRLGSAYVDRYVGIMEGDAEPKASHAPVKTDLQLELEVLREMVYSSDEVRSLPIEPVASFCREVGDMIRVRRGGVYKSGRLL